MLREQKLQEFLAWSQAHITGDEKGEATFFPTALFQAFGHPGVLDVGGHAEVRIRKEAEDGDGTASASADQLLQKLALL